VHLGAPGAVLKTSAKMVGLLLTREYANSRLDGLADGG
tara:strand:+ start:531 stop:644 length:114 start_codon:yes stop_codon:yes gene_type:complete